MTMPRQALRFAAVGLASTGASLAVIAAGMFLAGASAAVANAIGYATGFALSFGVNRAWTFGSKEPVAVLLPAYLLAVAVCYALNLAVVICAISLAGTSPFLAQLLGAAVYTPSLFVASRRLVFRRHQRQPRRSMRA